MYCGYISRTCTLYTTARPRHAVSAQVSTGAGIFRRHFARPAKPRGISRELLEEESSARFRGGMGVSAGVQAIAVETGSPDPENVTEMLLPLMREYLAGGMFDDVVLPVKSDDRSTRVGGS